MKQNVALVLLMVLVAAKADNLRPIIGVLAQDSSASGETTYIAASYVKFVESAGGRVVPIMTEQTEEYYDNIMNSVNGIIFPGGANSIRNDSGYGMAGQFLYAKILQKNANGVSFPLWATCLGFEMLGYLASQYTEFLVSCQASNLALPLVPYPGYEYSALFGGMPQVIADIFVSQNVTSNFHKYCYTTEDFASSGFGDDYVILSTNEDSNGLEFVSTVEHKTLPIYGTQFHPEKNAYEWKQDVKHDSIPHFGDAILASQYIGNFFIDQARLNDQSFETEDEEESMLIYQYTPKYVGDTGSSFIQVYQFE